MGDAAPTVRGTRATNAVASIKKPRTNRGLMVYNNPLILVPNGSEQFPAVNDTISTGRPLKGGGVSDVCRTEAR